MPSAAASEPSPPTSSQRKRSLASSPSTSAADAADNRRKAPKVSRACDLCKSKKAKCTGTRPCPNCTRKGVPCVYDAEYKRGRPPTPPPGALGVAAIPYSSTKDDSMTSSVNHPENAARKRVYAAQNRDTPTSTAQSRASPDLEMAEIEGQYFDPTSGLTFLHRAWKRLSAQRGQSTPEFLSGTEKSQVLKCAADKPYLVNEEGSLPIPSRFKAMELMAFYFDVCVVTYRLLHRQTVTSWLDAVLHNVEREKPVPHGLGHAKSAAVLVILAIVTLRREKLRNPPSDDTGDIRSSEQLFCASTSLTDAEPGLPRLESAQARLLQVIYLLQTTRMNQAWYVFGETVRIISALGLHRHAGRKRNGAMSKDSTPDYIKEQCRRRVFWTAYTIDMYLSVVLGRPRSYHDDDIDQDFPDLVNDEDMTSQGPSNLEPLEDCNVEALVLHARLAQIIGKTSRTVYSIKDISKQDRVSAAHRLGEELHDWRVSLPPHLSTIRPATLVPSFRRQNTALKLAYSHAIMHANRTFLLGNAETQSGLAALKDSVTECLSAARIALETVDAMAKDGILFHAFWWTSYVTFCALSVVYVWEIQQRSSGNAVKAADDRSLAKLFDLAEKCQSHLVKSTVPESPNRRYSIILEELRLEARNLSSGDNLGAESIPGQQRIGMPGPFADSRNSLQSHQARVQSIEMSEMALEQGDTNLDSMWNPLGAWETTDWLDLDSSAFGPFLDFNASPVYSL